MARSRGKQLTIAPVTEDDRKQVVELSASIRNMSPEARRLLCLLVRYRTGDAKQDPEEFVDAVSEIHTIQELLTNG